ncbi:MAG: cytochrome c1 [Betaproteobacteria bacterium]|nr:cytochrome c1 [Betaproteobacteria bacterium]MDH5220164.1 cytochrome c1 [Betaproteobacteria bacterium]MDH5351330.1 cytochrome c1 [Betaproteobacteria bacterium]
MKTLLAALAFVPATLLAAGGGHPLDRAPIEPRDVISLQAGARTFVNYCLNCHGAQFMRYNRLTDLGLTEAQIRDNLMFAADKVGETMKVSMSVQDGKAWFGVPPPDLSVISRSRGADWLYTYLRTFYRDDKTPSGWNNKVFPNAAMPHVLWKLQAEQNAVEYDRTVRDLVNFLVYVGEPSAQSRKNIGIVVLFVLGVVFVFAYAMKKAFWKDIR